MKVVLFTGIVALFVGLLPASVSAQCVAPWCNSGWYDQEQAGTTLHPTYFSAIHGENIGYRVYLPSSYDSEVDRHYPLILWMDGYGSAEVGFNPYSYLVDAMIAGTLQESVIVTLNSIGSTYWHDDAQSLGTSATIQAYSTVIDEMIPHLEQTYRLEADPGQRAIVGYSMGGYGAFNLALHSGFFRTVISLDGALWLPGNESVPMLYSCHDDPSETMAHNIHNVLAEHAAEASQLNAMIIRANPWYNDQAVFSQSLAATGAEVEYELLPAGNHDYNSIIADVGSELISFLGAKLAATPAAVVRLKVLLDGPWSGGPLMNGTLAANGLVPLTEPYTSMGYIHWGNGGGEQTTPAILGATGDNGIVDWVFLELRSKDNPTQVLATRSALLQRDGDVVDAEGRPDVGFALSPDQYYVAVHHRNHLSIMTANPIALSGTGSLLDLTMSVASLYGGTSAAKSQNGRVLMYAGDVDRNGVLTYVGSGNDRDPILSSIGGSIPTATTTGYRGEDVNLDGVVRYVGGGNDRDPILQNVGGSVPTATHGTSVP